MGEWEHLHSNSVTSKCKQYIGCTCEELLHILWSRMLYIWNLIKHRQFTVEKWINKSFKLPNGHFDSVFKLESKPLNLALYNHAGIFPQLWISFCNYLAMEKPCNQHVPGCISSCNYSHDRPYSKIVERWKEACQDGNPTKYDCPLSLVILGVQIIGIAGKLYIKKHINFCLVWITQKLGYNKCYLAQATETDLWLQHRKINIQEKSNKIPCTSNDLYNCNRSHGYNIEKESSLLQPRSNKISHNFMVLQERRNLFQKKLR